MGKRSQPQPTDRRAIHVRLHFKAHWALLFFPRSVRAFVLGTHVFFRHPRRKVSSETLRHELAHVCQYADLGMLGFLWAYFWKERHRPYREKSFEVEARRCQGSMSLIRRRWPGYRLVLRQRSR